MGLLTNIVGNIASAAGEYASTRAKLENDKEVQALKEKAEIAREARISEAWSKQHELTRGEAMVDQQFKINEDAKIKANDRLTKREDDVFVADYKHNLENDPNGLDYKKAAAAISQSEASVKASLAQAGKYNAEAMQEGMRFDLQQRAIAGDDNAVQALSLLEKGSGRTDISRNVGTDERPALQKGYVDYKGVEHFAESDKGSKPVYIKDKQTAEDLVSGMIEQKMSIKFPNGRPESDGVFSASDNVKAQQKEYDDYRQVLDKTRNDSVLDLMGVKPLQESKGGGMLNSNNFGNVRSNDGAGFKDIKTPEEGVSAITDRMDRYANGIKTESNPTGKPATTLLEFTSIYAPKADGNDPVAYAKIMSEKMGIGINDPVDLKDTEIKKMAVPLIMLQENRSRAEKAFNDPRVMRAIANIGNNDDKKDDDKKPTANAVWNPKTGKIERL